MSIKVLHLNYNMWFLRGKPTAMNFQAIIVSEPGGYQLTKYRFQMDCDAETLKDGKVWLSIAFPWSPHKKDGSFEIDTSGAHSEHFTVGENVTVIDADNVSVIEKPRVLKRSPDVHLMNVQEMYNWYLDDYGFATMWLTPSSSDTAPSSSDTAPSSQWYELNYRHKIDAESVLFFPTRFPSVISGAMIPITGTLIAVDAERADVPKWLEHVSKTGNADTYKYLEWDWSSDTMLHTSNWDSSDDDLVSDSDEE